MSVPLTNRPSAIYAQVIEAVNGYRRRGKNGTKLVDYNGAGKLAVTNSHSSVLVLSADKFFATLNWYNKSPCSLSGGFLYNYTKLIDCNLVE